MNNTTLNTLLQNFKIPSDFARYDNVTEDVVLAQLNEWKHNAHHILIEIQTLLKTSDASCELSLQEQASVISVAASFDGNGPWITSASQNSARGMTVYC